MRQSFLAILCLGVLAVSPMGLAQSQPPRADENPAQQAGPTTPAPELLKEAFARPALSLDQFEQWAAASNPTLRETSSLVRQSLGQAQQAGLLPNPSAGYEGAQIRGGDYGGGEQGAFVQQTFVLGGKLGLRRNVYQQQAREGQLEWNEQRYRVTSDVQQSFYRTLAAQEIVHLRQQLLKIAEDAVVTAHQLANVGQADAPDVLQAEVEAEQAKLDYTTAQYRFLQEFHGLAALVGKPNLPVAPLQGSLEEAPQIDTDEIIQRLVRDSPTVKVAQQDVVRAEAELKSARREVVPDLTIRGGLQQNFEALHSLGAPVGVQGFATASIGLPVFNRNQGNVAAARADVERARAEVERVQLSLRQSAEPLVEMYLANAAQARRYKTEMIPRARRAYELYLNRYQNMAAAYPLVIVSQRTLFQLQVAYIEVLENLWTGAVALQNYTLDGGLQPVVTFGNPGSTVNMPNTTGGLAQ